MHSPTVRSAFVALAFVVCGAASVQAQPGRADLRYASPLPSLVVYTTIDSLESTVSGLPTGDMTSSGYMTSTNEIRFTVADTGIAVRAMLRSLTGEMSTPMGSMPVDVGESTPVEFVMTATGPDLEQLPTGMATSSMNNPMAAMGDARAASGLLMLPGRALAIGETWTDTTTMTPDPEEVEGLTVEMTIVTRGTYTGDTAVAGRTLNVLMITTEMKVDASGTVQNMEIAQTTNMNSEEKVLWDSARHVAVHRDATATTTGDAFMPQMAMTMRTEARTRSITTSDITN